MSWKTVFLPLLLQMIPFVVSGTDCLYENSAVLRNPCQTFGTNPRVYEIYRARLLRALEEATNKHPYKRAWDSSEKAHAAKHKDSDNVITDEEARILLAYGRASIQGYKMNDTDPIMGDQMVTPLFYFLTKVSEKLQQNGFNTSETLYFVRTDKRGYSSCWPRWPTSFSQPAILYKDKLKAMVLAGNRGTVFQIKPRSTVDFGYYLGENGKDVTSRFLFMPCTKFMIKDKELINMRPWVYLEEMDPDAGKNLVVNKIMIFFMFMGIVGYNEIL